MIKLFGTRAQIGATERDIEDLRGNADGVWNYESGKALDVASATSTVPALNKLARFLSVGLSTRDEIKTIAEFTAAAEARFGEPLTTLAPGDVRSFELFRAQKAVALQRIQRAPSELKDFFVDAAGEVAGERITARRIFCQHLAPQGRPTGKVVVVSPGFQETARNFYEQAVAASRAGHDVILMDHQWAGHSDGKRGAIDRGFGMARDVAAVAASAQRFAAQRYGEDGKVVLLANSMGAAAALIAMTMNDAGLLQLDSGAMPRGVSAVLQAPYLAATPSWTNTLLRAASRLPLLNQLAMPSPGLPKLTSEDIAAQKTAQGAVSEGTVACLAAMTAADPDVRVVLDMIASGSGPRGRVELIHGVDDPLAHIEGSRRLATQLGDRGALLELATSSHVVQQSPTHQHHAVAALQRLP